MLRTLFVSDLDGTLLGVDGSLASLSATLLNDAIAAGALFTVATARTPATVDVLLRDVDMRLPAVVMTGAALWEFDSHRFRNPRFIPQNDLLEALKIFDSFGVYPFIYTLDDVSSSILNVFYFNPNPSPVDRKFIAARSNLPLKHFILNPSPLTLNPLPLTLLLFASGPKETLRQLQSALQDQTPALSVSCYDDIYNPGVGLIEIFAPGVSKAEAIKRLRGELDVNRIVAFGDSENDLPMFAVADISVAVANAVPPVLEAADFVIGPNTANAVPQFILDNLD